MLHSDEADIKLPHTQLVLVKPIAGNKRPNPEACHETDLYKGNPLQKALGQDACGKAFKDVLQDQLDV